MMAMAWYVEHLRHVYGYTAILAVIALENVGLFVPGETMLITRPPSWRSRLMT